METLLWYFFIYVWIGVFSYNFSRASWNYELNKKCNVAISYYFNWSLNKKSLMCSLLAYSSIIHFILFMNRYKLKIILYHFQNALKWCSFFLFALVVFFLDLWKIISSLKISLFTKATHFSLNHGIQAHQVLHS